MSIANPATQHDDALHAIEAELGSGEYPDGSHRWLPLGVARDMIRDRVGVTEPRARRLLADLIDEGHLVAIGASAARRVTTAEIARAERARYESKAARLDRIAERLDELGIEHSDRSETDPAHPAHGLRQAVSMRWEAIEQLLALHDAAVDRS
jgi:hypothetical protein